LNYMIPEPDGSAEGARAFSWEHEPMRALVCSDGGVSVVDLPRLEARGETLVRVTLSGICNTDLEIARGYAGFRGTLGHELVGVVEASDDGAALGARVVGEINAGCGVCPLCAGGDSRHCASRTVLGIIGRDGAHAELVRLPSRNLLHVPRALADRHAVFAEPLAAACSITERIPVDAATRVAVVGDGKLGLLCAQVLKARGARPILIGKHPSKLAVAERLRIETVEASGIEAQRSSFDLVIEASGGRTGFDAALILLRPRGVLVLKSTFHGNNEIDTTKIVVDEITIVGSRCGRLADALTLLEAGSVDVESLITEVLPLSRGVDAMTRASAPGVLKVMLDATR
jgi:threonine dehydrogenase-like Zn-dependent dehydrogenase